MLEPEQNSFDSNGRYIGTDLDSLPPLPSDHHAPARVTQLVQERDVSSRRASPALRRISPTPPESKPRERSRSPVAPDLFGRRVLERSRTPEVGAKLADERSHSPKPQMLFGRKVQDSRVESDDLDSATESRLLTASEVNVI